MASYNKQWRKRNAEVLALAASSSSDEDNDDSIQEFIANSSGSEPLATSSHDTDSDVGFSDRVLSLDNSSEFENSESDNSESDREISESEVESETSESENIGADIAAWSAKNKCTRTALGELLRVLRRHGHQLPKDARTLLQTPRKIDSVAKCGGQYAYFGIESCILKILANNPSFSLHDSIGLNVNIDGVPLFKSSGGQFWPILCSFARFQPFVVALYYGTEKPSVAEEYLSDFIEDYRNLKENGITYENKKFEFHINAFVCDAPARAFVKGIKGHNAYYSCERCTVKGSWSGRVVFNGETDCGCHSRTEETFKSIGYKDHQVQKSPLTDTDISCIQQFSLDYMHLVCLGVVKRLIAYLKKGPPVCRLSPTQKCLISENLVSLNGCMPSEFARQPRSIFEVERWKATEFRQFLLYTGPVVLKDVLPTRHYKHFLSLTIALSILLDDEERTRNSYLNYAKQLLVYFVKKCKHLYGDNFTVYNVHGLIHLHEDVRFFNTSLNDISAFQFENYLQTLKKYVRKSRNPIAQVTKRLVELEKVNEHPARSKRMFTRVSTRLRDSCFLLHADEFAFVVDKRPDDRFVCDVIKLRHMSNFFDSPCESKLFNITYIRNLHDRTKRRVLERRDFRRKAVCLPYHQGHVLFPMLHEVERTTMGT